MANKKNHNERNLTDVFKELQQKRDYDKYQYEQQHENSQSNFNGITTYISSNKKMHKYDYSIKQKNKKINSTKTFSMKKLLVLIAIVILLVSFALLYISNSFNTMEVSSEIASVTTSSLENFEENNNKLDLNYIISTNVDNSTIKESVNEEREVAFSIKYQSVDNLPKGEEAIVQPGVNGKSKIEAVRTYENGSLISETIVGSTPITQPTEQIVNIGTSQFLKDYQVHLGDIMYVVAETELLEKANSNSKEIATIPATLDVKLLELADNYCKVSYDDKTGYVLTSNLTSATVAPEMVDKARVQRILRDVKIDMPLNKKSGLAESDFKKILSGNSSDTNKIFENNYKDFFDAEQKYNINGIFLASLAIHESGWGTSQIATDKKNLFGYGSYDRDPYNMSYEFTTYKEGIELVAKSLVKYYINPVGTEIYDKEKAVATYYNGSTLQGVNTKYSTDPDWHKKVFNYMEMLYNKLK